MVKWGGQIEYCICLGLLEYMFLYNRRKWGRALFTSYSRFTGRSNFAYSVRFFRESVVGGRVKQSPQTLQQELAGGKSFKMLQSLWRLLHSTIRHALTEKPNGIRKI